jgi:transcriptional regulator with XRE-family HTH domain
MSMTTHYGTKTKELRVKRAWSQEQLADIAGVNVRTIQRIEHGEGASFESLKAVANAFGVNVEELLAPPPAEPQPGDKKGPQQPRVMFLGRVRTGRELFNFVGGADAYSYENDDVDGDDVELIAQFFQDIQDWGDLWGGMEPAERVRVPRDFNPRIGELEERGLWVFAGSRPQPFAFNRWEKQPEIIKLNTVFVIIVKKDNPAIIRLGHEDAALAVAQK